MMRFYKHDKINEFAELIADWRSMSIARAVCEHDSLWCASRSKMLSFSPTILSQILSQLTGSGIIARHKTEGVEEALYSPIELVKGVVYAYHIFKDASIKLAKAHSTYNDTSVCKLVDEGAS
jgi:DNA-binding HxlR family transcriptional regulator